MQPPTQCPVEGCTSTKPEHLATMADPNRRGNVHVDHFGFFFRCSTKSDGARCLRKDEHPGPHLFATDIPEPEPVYEVDEVEVVFDGRNKPTFQHLLNKRKEQP